MSEEKESIGQDVLGGGYPTSRMSEKKRKELQKKLKEQLAKKKAEEEAKRKEELEKLPKESIPGETPGDLTPEERAQLEQRAALTGELLEDEEKVHVKEHYRGKPGKSKKKKNEEKIEAIF